MSGSDELLFACTQCGYLVTVKCRGAIDQAASLREFVSQRLRAEDARVTLDLSSCRHLDSTFLGSLATLHQRHNHADAPRFLIYADLPQREALFGSCRLDTLLSFAETRPEPVGEFHSLTEHRLNCQEFGRLVMESHQRLADLGGKDAEAFQQIADRIAQELDKVKAPS